MILSDQEIIKAVQDNEIQINPFSESKLKPAAYTLTLSPDLLIPKKVAEVNGNAPELSYQEITMDESGYLVQPGAFLLAKTSETVGLGQKINACLDARTTHARIGLNFLQGSM